MSTNEFEILHPRDERGQFTRKAISETAGGTEALSNKEYVVAEDANLGTPYRGSKECPEEVVDRRFTIQSMEPVQVEGYDLIKADVVLDDGSNAVVHFAGADILWTAAETPDETQDMTEEETERYIERCEVQTRVVAAELGIRSKVLDDGAGAYIRMTERETANDMIAFVPNPYDAFGTEAERTHWRVQDDETGEMWVSDDLNIDSAPTDVAAWLRTVAGDDPDTTIPERPFTDAEVAADLYEVMNGWYSCVGQATTFLAEETAKNPKDPQAAFEAASERYRKDPARNNTTWVDEYDADEAMDVARDAFDQLVYGDKASLRIEVFREDDSPALADAFPTYDRAQAARLVITAIENCGAR